MRELSRLKWCAIAALCLAADSSADPLRPCVEGAQGLIPEMSLLPATKDPGSSSIDTAQDFNLAYPHRQSELLVFPRRSGPPLESEVPTWDSLWNSVGAKVVRFDPAVPMYEIKVAPELVLDGVARSLMSDGGNLIRSIEANSCVFPHQQSTSQDPSSPEQWGHWRIGLQEAWLVTTGKSSTVVAIIDSGMNHNHADLACNFWVNPCELPNGIDDPCPSQPADGLADDFNGWNFREKSNNLFDKAPHGTLIAGIVGACRNSIGVVGVNWSVSLMDLPTYETIADGPTLGYALSAMRYAIRNGAAVVNLSWTTAYSEELKGLIRGAPDVIVTTAAGDEGEGGRKLEYPFETYPCGWTPVLPNLICVTSSGLDKSDKKYKSANFGKVVQIAAPGEEILSTQGLDTGAKTGTSFAAPYVAGVVALLKAQFPDATTGEIVRRTLCGDDVVALDGMTQPGGSPGTGRRLNAAKALACEPVEDDVTEPAEPRR